MVAIRRHRERPDNALCVAMLLEHTRHGSRDAQPVATHDEWMRYPTLIRPGRAHRRAVLRPQLERIARLDPASLLQPTATASAYVTGTRLCDITHDLRRVVAPVAYAAQVVLYSLAARAQRPRREQ